MHICVSCRAPRRQVGPPAKRHVRQHLGGTKAAFSRSILVQNGRHLLLGPHLNSPPCRTKNALATPTEGLTRIQFRAARSAALAPGRPPTRALGSSGQCAPGVALCAAAFGLWRAQRPAKESRLSLFGAGRQRAAVSVGALRRAASECCRHARWLSVGRPRQAVAGGVKPEDSF
jgi:hypothetical protein